MYFGSEAEAVGKKINLNQISEKLKLLEIVILFACENEGEPEDLYLAVLKRECIGCLDLDYILTTISQIREWLVYRNEIIHGLLNKNHHAVDAEIESVAKDGMVYVRALDSQIKLLKKKNTIRKMMHL